MKKVMSIAALSFLVGGGGGYYYGTQNSDYTQEEFNLKDAENKVNLQGTFLLGEISQGEIKTKNQLVTASTDIEAPVKYDSEKALKVSKNDAFHEKMLKYAVNSTYDAAFGRHWSSNPMTQVEIRYNTEELEEIPLEVNVDKKYVQLKEEPSYAITLGWPEKMNQKMKEGFLAAGFNGAELDELYNKAKKEILAEQEGNTELLSAGREQLRTKILTNLNWWELAQKLNLQQDPDFSNMNFDDMQVFFPDENPEDFVQVAKK